MQYIIFNLILGAMAVAGLSAIWRNWIEDHISWEKFIKRTLGRMHKVLTCGPCFTYWAALAYSLIFKPLAIWQPANFNIEFLALLVNVFLQWMAFAWLCVFLRFSYTTLQQVVRDIS